MRHRPSLAVLLTLLCVTGFTGCECASRNPVAPPDPTRRVVRLELSPATDTLVVGDTRTFVAVAHDSTDAVIVGAPVAWSSDDPAVVSVGAGGAAVAVGEGVTRVIARSGTAADTAIVAVIVRTGWYLQTSGTTADLAGVAFRRDGRVGVAVDGGRLDDAEAEFRKTIQVAPLSSPYFTKATMALEKVKGQKMKLETNPGAPGPTGPAP